MRLLSVFLLIFSTSIEAERLNPVDNHELTHILSRLVTVNAPIHFEEQGYSVLFYGVDFGGHCAEAKYCRGLVELLVVTTEMGDEGPVSNLYRFPKKHEWKIEHWKHLSNGKQAIYLKEITYESNKPDSKAKEKSFILTTTWTEAELNAL